MPDLALLAARALDLPRRIRRRLGGSRTNYRDRLFADLRRRLPAPPRRILEIGPKDGLDTRRLAGLAPQELVLVDLPDKEAEVRGWLAGMALPNARLVIGNIMYDRAAAELAGFDLVWCTGVLYHNPEQLRMVRRLFDMLVPGGLLVLESATARHPALRDRNCVEIWHEVPKSVHRRHHLAKNVTHLPSRLAIRSWLEMVGFEAIEASDCHRGDGRVVAMNRIAYIARRGDGGGSDYYAVAGGYPVGRAL